MSAIRTPCKPGQQCEVIRRSLPARDACPVCPWRPEDVEDVEDVDEWNTP